MSKLSPLHDFVCALPRRHDRAEAIKWLLQRGLSAERTDEAGRDPLMHAAGAGATQVILESQVGSLDQNESGLGQTRAGLLAAPTLASLACPSVQAALLLLALQPAPDLTMRDHRWVGARGRAPKTPPLAGREVCLTALGSWEDDV